MSGPDVQREEGPGDTAVYPGGHPEGGTAQAKLERLTGRRVRQRGKGRSRAGRRDSQGGFGKSAGCRAPVEGGGQELHSINTY